MLLVAMSATATQAQQGTTSVATAVEVVPFRLQFGALVDRYVDVQVETTAGHAVVLMPVTAVLTALSLEHQLDTRRGELRVGKRVASLDPTTDRLTPLEVYVSAMRFDSLTQLHVQVDLTSLVLTVSTTEPVMLSALRRTRTYAARSVGATFDSTAPLLHPRSRRLIGAGTIAYRGEATQFDRTQRRSLNLRLGGELVGGEFEVRALGETDGHALPRVRPTDARWRYVRDGSAFSQLTLGRVTTGATDALVIDGVEISNRPVVPYQHVGRQRLDGTSRPEALVEVLLSGEIAGTTRADAAGRWQLSIPAAYGSSALRVRHTSLTGDVWEEERLVHVPFGLVPVGRLEYHAAGGRMVADSMHALHGRAAFGITEWLTVRSALNARSPLHGLLDSAATAERLTTYWTGGLTARLFGVASLGLDVSPRELSRASLEMSSASPGSPFLLSLFAARLARGAPSLSAGTQAEYGGHAWLPVSGLPLTARLSGSDRTLVNGTRERAGSAEVVWQAGAAAPSVQYRMRDQRTYPGRARTQELLASAQWFTDTRVLRPLQHLFVRVAVGTDLAAPSVRTIEVYASRAIGTRAQVDVSWTHASRATRPRLETRFNWRFGSTRVSAGAVHDGRQTVYSQSANGSLLWDAGARRLVATERSIVGRAGAAVRLFLDENGNGRLDGDERSLDGARVRLSGGLPLDARGTRVSDLFANQRYIAQVDKASIPNPQWVPVHESVAFVADPNRLKPIDIPLYVGASIEGQARYQPGLRFGAAHPDSARPVPGLRLALLRVDGAVSTTLPTFADGAFYHPGLPPGTYELRIDDEQLRRLGMVAEPAVRRFTVEPSKDGAMIVALDFLLRDASDREDVQRHP